MDFIIPDDLGPIFQLLKRTSLWRCRRHEFAKAQFVDVERGDLPEIIPFLLAQLSQMVLRQIGGRSIAARDLGSQGEWATDPFNVFFEKQRLGHGQACLVGHFNRAIFGAPVRLDEARRRVDTNDQPTRFPAMFSLTLPCFARRATGNAFHLADGGGRRPLMRQIGAEFFA